MKRNQNKRRHIKSPGLSPGSLIFTGQKHLDTAQLCYICYSQEKLEIDSNAGLRTISQAVEQTNIGHSTSPTSTGNNINWVQCIGIHDLEIIKNLGLLFKIDSLTLEDILSPDLRSKYENFSNYLYICLKLFNTGDSNNQIEIEQLSVVFGRNFLITFHERNNNIVGPLFKRLEVTEGRLRQRASDYLATTIIDAVVDSYFPVIDSLQDRLDQIDSTFVNSKRDNTIQDLHALKRDVFFIQRNISPLREILNFAIRAEDSPFSDTTDPYLRDTLDHLLAMQDSLENCREQCNNLIDLHFSLINSRTNEVIRFLTIVSSIFIPLTFVTSIYGMNFKFMPELEWPYSYPVVLAVLCVIFLGFAWYLRRKEWL